MGGGDVGVGGVIEACASQYVACCASALTVKTGRDVSCGTTYFAGLDRKRTRSSRRMEGWEWAAAENGLRAVKPMQFGRASRVGLPACR
jgi:hypothetical protein